MGFGLSGFVTTARANVIETHLGPQDVPELSCGHESLVCLRRRRRPLSAERRRLKSSGSLCPAPGFPPPRWDARLLRERTEAGGWVKLREL